MLQLLSPEPLAGARAAADGVLLSVLGSAFADRPRLDAAWAALEHVAGGAAPVRLGIGAEVRDGVVVGMRLYLDLFCAGPGRAADVLAAVCAATEQPSPLAALGDDVPPPRILGVDVVPGRAVRLKAYASAPAVGRARVVALLARAGGAGEAAVDAVAAVLGGAALTARSSLVAVDGTGQRAKVDLHLPDHVADDAQATAAVEGVLVALGCPVEEYRAEAARALEGIAPERSAGVHQHLGVRPSPGGTQVAVYFRPRSSGPAWLPARSRPRVLGAAAVTAG